MSIKELEDKIKKLNHRQRYLLYRLYQDIYGSMTLVEAHKISGNSKRTLLLDLNKLEKEGLIYRFNSWITFIEPVRDKRKARKIQAILKRYF